MAFDATDFQVTALPDPLTLKTPRERLEYLARLLPSLPDGRFDMNYWAATPDAYPVARDEFAHACGTTGCIGGWTVFSFSSRSNLHNTLLAANLLGLDTMRAEALFYPPGNMADGTSAYEATPADAAQVLDHLLNTGEVDWSVARKARG